MLLVQCPEMKCFYKLHFRKINLTYMFYFTIILLVKNLLSNQVLLRESLLQYVNKNSIGYFVWYDVLAFHVALLFS